MTAIPNNRKIDAEGSRQVKGIDTGGGDVYQAGNNAFTGSNIFATPPTSAQDADSGNELVRFSQLLVQEEGTWTPTLETTGLTYTIDSASGTYVKIGKLVFVTIDIDISATSGVNTTNASMDIDGLPFTAAASLPQYLTIGRIADSDWTIEEVSQKTATVIPNNDKVSITDNNTGIAPSGVDFGTQGRILISGTYRTD